MEANYILELKKCLNNWRKSLPASDIVSDTVRMMNRKNGLNILRTINKCGPLFRVLAGYNGEFVVEGKQVNFSPSNGSAAAFTRSNDWSNG